MQLPWPAAAAELPPSQVLRYNRYMEAKSRNDAEDTASRLMQVLLVDHDGVNRYSLRISLQRVGYFIVEASSADEALELLNSQDFDLILTEIDLPDMQGLALLQRIKAQRPDAVVILLAENPSIQSVIQALRFGAYDILLKPCSSQEIRTCADRGIERARLLMRRRRMLDAIERNVSQLVREAPAPADADGDGGLQPPTPTASARAASSGARIALAGLSIAPGRYQIGNDAQTINLTPTEFDMLMYLAAHRSRVVTCQELVREVRGYNADESEAREVIRPHISNLRRKLKTLGDYANLVVNVRGLGYRLGDISSSA